MSVTSIEETSGSPLSGYTGEPVDYSSLTFEATYEDGTTGSVTPTSCTPSVWGEPGTETITFNFADTDVTCDVEGESIAPTPTLTSLTYTGSLTNDQFVGSAPDLTGLTFTAHYSDSTLDQEVTPTSVLPATYAEAGSATVTAAYTDEYGTASVEISVTVIEELVLDHIEASGVTTNNQIRGQAPDLTGIEVKAVYTNSSERVLADSDYTLVDAPSVWPMGNPDNLEATTLTISYTENGITKTCASPLLILRYSDEFGQLFAGTPGHIYYNFESDWTGMKDTDEVMTNGAQDGDYVALLMPFDIYEAYQQSHSTDTKYESSAWATDVTDYGIVQSASGTINESGYIPKTGVYEGNDLSESYIAVSSDGNGAGTEKQFVLFIGQYRGSGISSGGYRPSKIVDHISMAEEVPIPVILNSTPELPE